MKKSTVEEIRARFDQSVELYSNLETGQVTFVDARLSLEIATEASRRLVPHAQTLLDLGCGAGNYTMMMLSKMPHLACTMVDLSQPMLDAAKERVSPLTDQLTTLQGDIREVELPSKSFDIVLAGSVLHHLREDSDWEHMFAKVYRVLKPNGCFMVVDLIAQEHEAITYYTWARYAEYLKAIGNEEYMRQVLSNIAKEDSPRSLFYQMSLMRMLGFHHVDLLHKHMCFAVFCGLK
ncbi:MAG: class I SAM-dependent methyltransferase [Burkholderiales bacterium]|jgi:tRNA (cmo5U34)-methyltransferase|nr:class I SAM-dependent methyltransferase [Burkholderiales bacterium]